uniref:uncharacterized protein LOC120337669 n=1 Tax=Styela clava TaxID=7725 RepID=UPI001939DC1E|nr:uncharacterized protein LOC120337669 [Styela clava]
MNCWTVLAMMIITWMTKMRTGNGLQEVTINEGIPMPISPKFSSVNVNHILRWDYNNVFVNRSIRFDVEIKNIFYDGWMREPTCNGTSEKYCEVGSGIHEYDEGCPELNYFGEFRGRVRACLMLQGSKECSKWMEAEKDLKIPEDDQLSPPNFDIEGIFRSTQMRIINHPILVEYLNKSLNCYHDNKLEYSIKYWGTNDTTQKLQEASASFGMEFISLRLFEEPRSDTELCVEMTIVHKVRMGVRSQPKQKCFVYERDTLLPPDFKIDGVFDSTQLRLINNPVIDENSNKSLNFYYDNNLNYEIKYWGTNDSSQRVQESPASFDMESISLRLFEEPKSETELCVQMRTVHKVKSYDSEWKLDCIIYNRNDPILSQVALTAIVTGGCAAMLLALILLFVKLNRVYKKVYPSKFDVPNDLANLMMGSPENITLNSSSPHTEKIDEFDHIVLAISEEEADNDVSTKQHPFVLDSREIVHLLSPEILKSSNLAETQKPKRSKTVNANYLEITHVDGSGSSDIESIPYICTLEEPVSTSDSTSLQFFEEHEDQFESSTPVEMPDGKNNDAHFMREKVGNLTTKCHSESNLYHAFFDTLPSNCIDKYFVERSKKYQSSNRIDSYFSDSSVIPEYAKVRFVYCDTYDYEVKNSDGRLYTTVSEAMLSRQKTLMNPLNQLFVPGFDPEKLKRSNSHPDMDTYSAPGTKQSVSIQSMDDESQYIKEDMVSVTNPTYSSKPSTFDFIDNVQPQQVIDNIHSYGNFNAKNASPLKNFAKQNTNIATSKNTISKTKSLHQRRHFKMRIHDMHRSKESKLFEETCDGILQPLTTHKYIKENITYVKTRSSHRRHSCSSGSSTLSPIRGRTVSADSGYHMGSFSVSDECFSLSPPLSPDDMNCSEVFSYENSPKSNRLEDFHYKKCSFPPAKYSHRSTSLEKTNSDSNLSPYVQENVTHSHKMYILPDSSINKDATGSEMAYVKVKYNC